MYVLYISFSLTISMFNIIECDHNGSSKVLVKKNNMDSIEQSFIWNTNIYYTYLRTP
jgi:hypothetical protein